MAARRPFRVSEPRRVTPATADERHPPDAYADNPVSAEAAAALRDHKPLPLPSHNVVESNAHGHSPRIPWSAAKPLESSTSPYKNMK